MPLSKLLAGHVLSAAFAIAISVFLSWAFLTNPNAPLTSTEFISIIAAIITGVSFLIGSAFAYLGIQAFINHRDLEIKIGQLGASITREEDLRKKIQLALNQLQSESRQAAISAEDQFEQLEVKNRIITSGTAKCAQQLAECSKAMSQVFIAAEDTLSRVSSLELAVVREAIEYSSRVTQSAQEHILTTTARMFLRVSDEPEYILPSIDKLSQLGEKSDIALISSAKKRFASNQDISEKSDVAIREIRRISQ